MYSISTSLAIRLISWSFFVNFIGICLQLEGIVALGYVRNNKLCFQPGQDNNQLVHFSIDEILLAATIGAVVSLFVVFTGRANVPLILLQCWIWRKFIELTCPLIMEYKDAQLLMEAGILSLLLVPLLSLKSIAPVRDSDKIRQAVFKWLAFRIWFPSGLGKLREKTGQYRGLHYMTWFFERMHIPTIVGYYAHFFVLSWPNLRSWISLGGLTVELICPVFLLCSQPFAAIGAVGLMSASFFISISGNLGCLPLLSVAPALLSIEDKHWEAARGIISGCFYRRTYTGSTKSSKYTKIKSDIIPKNDAFQKMISQMPKEYHRKERNPVIHIVRCFLGMLFIACSIPRTIIYFANVPPEYKKTNGIVSHNDITWDSITGILPHFLTCAYREFVPVEIGFTTYPFFVFAIPQPRTEEIFFGGQVVDNDGNKTIAWEEYSLPCKPGPVNRRPCQFLGQWQWLHLDHMLSIQSWKHDIFYRGVVHKMFHLLNQGGEKARSIQVLLAQEDNPGINERPDAMKVELFEYRFTPIELWNAIHNNTRQDININNNDRPDNSNENENTLYIEDTSLFPVSWGPSWQSHGAVRREDVGKWWTRRKIRTSIHPTVYNKQLHP